MLPHPQLLRWSNWFSQWSFQVKHIKGKDNLITDYLSRKPPVLNTTVIPPPLCVYPIIDTSSSSSLSSADPNDILNMIENIPSEIKDQIKTLTLEARTKRIIKTLHDYLKKHQCRYAPTPLDTCSSTQYSRSLLLLLSLGKLIRRKLKIQPCHCALDTCKSIRIAPTCPDMNIVHYL